MLHDVNFLSAYGIWFKERAYPSLKVSRLNNGYNQTENLVGT